jgi:hypothetical protein
MTRALRDAGLSGIYNGSAARSRRRAFLNRHVDSLFCTIAYDLNCDCPFSLA